MKSIPMLRGLWTLLSLPSAFLVLGDVLGGAAWNGVNFVVVLYIVLSAGGFVGLILGFWAACSRTKILLWITSVSALAIAGLSALFAISFIFYRTPGIPLSHPVFIGPLHVPILLIYGAAFVFCSIEALLYLPKPGRL